MTPKTCVTSARQTIGSLSLLLFVALTVTGSLPGRAEILALLAPSGPAQSSTAHRTATPPLLVRSMTVQRERVRPSEAPLATTNPADGPAEPHAVRASVERASPRLLRESLLSLPPPVC